VCFGNEQAADLGAPNYCTECACGNGNCEAGFGETESNCPQDCVVCGDGVCGAGETVSDCKEDCYTPACGDGNCEDDFGEDYINCPGDCDPVCGDGHCTSTYVLMEGGDYSEDFISCAFDCGGKRPVVAQQTFPVLASTDAGLVAAYIEGEGVVFAIWDDVNNVYSVVWTDNAM
jgi:hypothetical protein